MGSRIRVEGAACFFAALLLLTVPLPWLGAMLLAAAIHELGHMAAVFFFGGRVLHLQIGLGGACILSDMLSRKKAAVSTLAGPAASLLTVFLYRFLPRTALCAFVQLVYNLLPIYPLDGGRCLYLLLDRECTCRRIEQISIGFIGLGVFAMVYLLRLGILPLLFFLILLWSRRKRPCKTWPEIVQ